MLWAKAPNCDIYGLFRVSRSHNPSQYSDIAKLTLRFYPHIGASWIKSWNHSRASTSCFMTFDPDIFKIWYHIPTLFTRPELSKTHFSAAFAANAPTAVSPNASAATPHTGIEICARTIPIPSNTTAWTRYIS